MSALRRGLAHLLCIVPFLAHGTRRESDTVFDHAFLAVIADSHAELTAPDLF